MTTIYEDLDLPDTGTPYPAEVRIRLAGAQGRPVLGKTVSTNKAIVGETVLRTGQGISSAGVWELDLVPNADILPAGTTWYINRKVGCQQFESYISVPVSGGPYEAFTREDDPLGTITPSALSAHAADPTLHGGGIEVDYAFTTTPIVVTGTGGGLTAAQVPSLVVTVPDVARPVYLHARLPVRQQSGGPAEQTWGVFPVGTYGFFNALDVVNPPSLSTTVTRTGHLWARLDPLSGGDYTIAASGASGNLTARLEPSAISRAFLRAIQA